MQALDTGSKVVRAAVAKTVAASLLSVMENSPMKDSTDEDNKQPSKKKKNTKVAKEDDQEDGRSGRSSPILAKSIPFTIQFRDLLRQLSSSYTSRSTSRQVRAGIILSYTNILKAVGGQFTNSNYPIILEHLLNDLISNPQIIDDRHRSLEARRHVRILLCNVIRRQLLNEPAKTMALRTIMAKLQKGKTAEKGNLQDGEAISADSTVSALTELAGLLQDLGSAITTDQVSFMRSALADCRNLYKKSSVDQYGIQISLSRPRPRGA